MSQAQEIQGLARNWPEQSAACEVEYQIKGAGDEEE